MREFAEKDGVEWTVTHAHYVNIGGFVFRIPLQKAAECYLKKTIVQAVIPPRSTIIEKNSRSLAYLLDENVNSGFEYRRRWKTFFPIMEEVPVPPGQDQRLEEPGNELSLNALCKTDKIRIDAAEALADGCQKQTVMRIIELHPNADQLLALRAYGIIQRLSDISVHIINGKSKRYAFIKGTALL